MQNAYMHKSYPISISKREKKERDFREKTTPFFSFLLSITPPWDFYYGFFYDFVAWLVGFGYWCSVVVLGGVFRERKALFCSIQASKDREGRRGRREVDKLIKRNYSYTHILYTNKSSF